MLTKRSSLLFLLCLCTNCHYFEPASFKSPKKTSILRLLKKSKNTKLNLQARMQFVDSAFKRSKKLPFDSLHLAVIDHKTILHHKAGQPDSTVFYDRHLLYAANRSANKAYQGKAHKNLGIYYKRLQVFDSAFYHFNASKTAFLTLKDSSNVGRRLMSMGLIQKIQGDYFGSKETLTESLDYLTLEKDAKYISSAQNALATDHRKLLNYPDAITYYSIAIDNAPFEKERQVYQNNLAATYIDSKKYDLAITLLKKLKKDTVSLKNKRARARVLDNLAYAQWHKGEDVAPTAFQKPLEWRKLQNDKRGQLASYTHLGEFYSKTEPGKAKAYFDSVITLSKTLTIPRAEKDALRFLMELQPKNVPLRDRYVFLQDSLYKQGLRVKTQFAKYKYDDQRKQESILRLEKENAQKELEVAQERNQKIISLAAGILLLLSLGFTGYYFVQRAKRQRQVAEREKQKEVYDTEVAMSQRIHDDFAGQLNHAMMLLDTNTPKATVKKVIGNIYDSSRDFSREINDIDTGPNFQHLLATMLKRYCPNKSLMTIGEKTMQWNTVPDFTKKTIFKVLQELMINMQKHSKADLIEVRFEQQKNALSITYKDYGVGASKEEVMHKNGLLNTEKRIRAINGSIIFETAKNKGFKALIRAPY